MNDLFDAPAMRAISLWQPWATAMAIGWKRNETRHWQVKYRGPLAIHAAKRWCVECRSMHQGQWTANNFPGNLPFGAIVAVVDVVDCVPTEQAMPGLSVREEAWGNYGPGRFAWITENLRQLCEPLPMKGRQGFWTLTDEERCAVEARFPRDRD